MNWFLRAAVAAEFWSGLPLGCLHIAAPNAAMDNGGSARPWLRILLMVISLLGVLSVSALNGEQLDPNFVTDRGKLTAGDHRQRLLRACLLQLCVSYVCARDSCGGQTTGPAASTPAVLCYKILPPSLGRASMADKPSSSSPPPTQPAQPLYLAGKNEKVGVLIDHLARLQASMMEPVPSTTADPPLRSPAENVRLFIDAMRHPVTRKIAFDVVERNCRDRFAHDEDALYLYKQLLGYVRRSRIDGAETEFIERFLPMLRQ
jgi:hypothetical protein